MGNLRNALLEMHLEAQISKTITLNRKSKKSGHFKPKLAKIINLKRKSKEIITSNPLLR